MNYNRLGSLVVVLVVTSILSIGPTPGARAQPVLNDLSLFQCSTFGDRLNALDEMNLNRKLRKDINDAVEDAREDLDELDDQYRQKYNRLEQVFASATSDNEVKKLAEDVGDIHGERLERILEFEVQLRQWIGNGRYGQYVQDLEDELKTQVDDQLERIVDQSARSAEEQFLFPRIDLSKQPVNFCPALPQE